MTAAPASVTNISVTVPPGTDSVLIVMAVLGKDAGTVAGALATVVTGGAGGFVVNERSPQQADTASAANTTPTTLDILALREHPDSSAADKQQIIEEYRRSAPGSQVLVKRVSWSSALSTPYGGGLAQSQMNPNHASVYAVLVSGAIGPGQPATQMFVVLRLADREPIFEAGLDSAAAPGWYRGLRDLD